MRCEICGANDGTLHRVREMMFGMGDEFRYHECQNCGCLSLMDVPNEISRYYPDGYYSKREIKTNLLRRLRDSVYLSRFSFLVDWRKRTDLDVIRRCKLRRQQSILDVGCGCGHLVRDLRDLGYRAEGIDPFIAGDIKDGRGTRVARKNLDEVRGDYDLLLFRHSLEHMPGQVQVLRSARKRLRPGGRCVVCTPVVGWAWRHYGVDWIQLDAPRHLFVHTAKSFTLIAETAGFRVNQVVYDSDEFQFWGSDLYRAGKPLQGNGPPPRTVLTQLRGRAEALNRVQEGDSAQFYLS
jgi:2-polyprenyl-3-methyl-5-hydroxy-6-metoxy-1,4-benzoquinol methylase